jgi:hypothetical protein
MPLKQPTPADEIRSRTAKITIRHVYGRKSGEVADLDLHVTLGWADDGTPCHVKIGLALWASSVEAEDAAAQVRAARRRVLENSSRAMEIICDQASAAMVRQHLTLGEILTQWRGTRLDPEGTCEAVARPEDGGRVTGPLDAAARLLQARALGWIVDDLRIPKAGLPGLVERLGWEQEGTP